MDDTRQQTHDSGFQLRNRLNLTDSNWLTACGIQAWDIFRDPPRRRLPRCLPPLIPPAIIGLALASGYPALTIGALFIPSLVANASTRRRAWLIALAFYLAVLWPLIPSARNFFGAQAGVPSGIAIWLCGSATLACPWILAWTPFHHRLSRLWRVPLVLLILAVPPVGLIGIASPLMLAGLLFPGTGYCGLIACAEILTILALSRPLYTSVIFFILIGLAAYVCNSIYTAPQLPGWSAIDTRFGNIAHATKDPLATFSAALIIQDQARLSKASVILFPEAVVKDWTDASEDFWRPFFNEIRTAGKTVLFGATLPLPVSSDTGYRNALLARGAHSLDFDQHIPVPFALWRPRGGVPLNLAGPATIRLAGKRAAVLICYEHFLAWPILSAMWHTPDVILAAANGYWAPPTVRRLQRMLVHLWARLFGIPYIMAVNL